MLCKYACVWVFGSSKLPIITGLCKHQSIFVLVAQVLTILGLYIEVNQCAIMVGSLSVD